MEKELELLQGTVQSVTFQNPENGYTVLRLLEDCGGECDGDLLRQTVEDEEALEKAVTYLLKKKWITAQRDTPRARKARSASSALSREVTEIPVMASASDSLMQQISVYFRAGRTTSRTRWLCSDTISMEVIIPRSRASFRMRAPWVPYSGSGASRASMSRM